MGKHLDLPEEGASSIKSKCDLSVVSEAVNVTHH